MKINENKAKELFLKQFPDGIGRDFAGREIIYEYYNQNCPEGWNVDHILPESLGGKNNEGNLQCANIISNQNKGNKTTWIDNNKLLQVRKIKYKPHTYKVITIKEIYLLEKLPSDIINNDIKLAKNKFLEKFPTGIGYDFMDRKIRVTDYKKHDSAYGWAFGYIISNIYGGKNTDDNIDIFHYSTLITKSHKTSWVDNDRYFQVRRKNGKSHIVEVYHNNGKTYIK